MRKIFTVISNIRNFLKKNADDNASAIAAQSAFFLILSFVPFMMFAISILAWIGISGESIEKLLSLDVFPTAGKYVNRVFEAIYPGAAKMAVTTAILALWSAGKGVFSITEGIRVIYKLDNRYNWFVKRLFSMGYTLIMAIAILISLGGTVLTEVFESWIKPFVKDLPYSVLVLYTLRYLVIFFVVTVLIALALKLYLWRRIENRSFCRLKVLLPGAFITSAGWSLMSLGIKAYVDLFNGFSVYGSLGTFAMIMVWIYFSMYIFICGVQINFMYRHEFYNFKLKFRRKS